MPNSTPGMCTVCIFFFNDTATTEIYTLSLHDALPISRRETSCRLVRRQVDGRSLPAHQLADRKSTRLNSSHGRISYAVFCLKKKMESKRSGWLGKSIGASMLTWLVDDV